MADPHSKHLYVLRYRKSLGPVYTPSVHSMIIYQFLRVPTQYFTAYFPFFPTSRIIISALLLTYRVTISALFPTSHVIISALLPTSWYL